MAVAAVVLAAAAAIAACSRPQAAATGPRTDRGTFPSGSIVLSYRLDRPAGTPPFPAVVVGHGSGRTTMDDSQIFAGGWLARGYAVLRYDKRGVGGSTGVYSGVGVNNSEQMIADLSADMAGAVAFLRTQADIDGTRIGLMGASQAGWIMPLAARRASVAFMIAVSGPTVSVGEEIYFSKFAENGAGPLDRAYDELARFSGLRGFDPRPVLEALAVRSLWLLGGADDSIPERNTVAILKAFIASGRPFTFFEYPNANHGLFDLSLGRAAPYWADIDRWMASGVRSG